MDLTDTLYTFFQRSEEVTHLAEIGDAPPKATLCRKTLQISKKRLRDLFQITLHIFKTSYRDRPQMTSRS